MNQQILCMISISEFYIGVIILFVIIPIYAVTFEIGL